MGSGRSTQRSLVAAAAAILLAGAAVALLRRAPRAPAPAPPPPAATPAPSPARRTVAVLGFRNASGRHDVDWLSTALAEVLRTALGAGGTLRTIAGEDVARMKVDLSLGDTESLPADVLARVRRNLGADLVLLGSYDAAGGKQGGTIELHLRVQDAAKGTDVAVLSESGSETKLLDLLSSAVNRLEAELGGRPPAGAERSVVRAALPAGAEAVRLYAEGLDRLRLFDALAARDLLARAAAADPASPLVHAALAQALSELGHDVEAGQEARKAFDLAAELPLRERLVIEARYRERTREWPRAVEIYRVLRSVQPDDLEYGLRLASAQASAGRGQDALATLAELRRLPPPTSLDPRIDLAEATVSNSLGDFRRAQASAAAAARKGTALGARLLVARARMAEGFALRSLGQQARATAANDEAQRLFAEAGDRKGVAQALLQTATVQRYQGDLERARTTADEALRIAREIGDKLEMGWAANRIAGILVEQGRLDEGLRMYGQTLAVWREIGDKNGEGTALNNIGETLWKRGDLPAARKTLEEGLALVRGIGGRRPQVFTLFNLGFVLYDQGDLAAARSAFQESLDISRQIGEESLGAVALFGLGRVLRAQGDLPAARKAHEESLKIRRRLEERGRAAESLVALAALAIDEGRGAEAEAQAREAVEELHAEGAQEESRARAVLAEALLAQRKVFDAQRAADEASLLASGGLFRSLRLRVALAAARVQAASARAAEAVKGLRALEAEAKAAGYVGFALEARLEMAQIELRFGDAEAGRAALDAVEAEAHDKGFGLIERRAAAALANGPPTSRP